MSLDIYFFGICPCTSHMPKFWYTYMITYSNFMIIVEPWVLVKEWRNSNEKLTGVIQKLGPVLSECHMCAQKSDFKNIIKKHYKHPTSIARNDLSGAGS